jgi:hypothetical protein
MRQVTRETQTQIQGRPLVIELHDDRIVAYPRGGVRREFPLDLLYELAPNVLHTPEHQPIVPGQPHCTVSTDLAAGPMSPLSGTVRRYRPVLRSSVRPLFEHGAGLRTGLRLVASE